MTKKILIIGISGVTCAGKTTIAMKLNQILPKSKIISQDEYFLPVSDPRHTWIPELNHINFDVLSSLDMEKLYSDVLDIIKDKDIKLKDKVFPSTLTLSKELQKQVYTMANESDLEILIIEGFCIFNYKPLLSLFHLKYYFTLHEEECRRRRETRVYEPPDCPGYFEQCVWPEYLKLLNEVQRSEEDIKYFSGDQDVDTSLKTILTDLLKYL